MCTSSEAQPQIGVYVPKRHYCVPERHISAPLHRDLPIFGCVSLCGFICGNRRVLLKPRRDRAGCEIVECRAPDKWALGENRGAAKPRKLLALASEGVAFR